MSFNVLTIGLLLALVNLFVLVVCNIAILKQMYFDYKKHGQANKLMKQAILLHSLKKSFDE